MTLESHPNIHLWQDMVTSLIEKDSVVGVRTQLGVDIHASKTILTSGTFLQGRIHLGTQQFQGGRSWRTGCRRHHRSTGRSRLHHRPDENGNSPAN